MQTWVLFSLSATVGEPSGAGSKRRVRVDAVGGAAFRQATVSNLFSWNQIPALTAVAVAETATELTEVLLVRRSVCLRALDNFKLTYLEITAHLLFATLPWSRQKHFAHAYVARTMKMTVAHFDVVSAPRLSPSLAVLPSCVRTDSLSLTVDFMCVHSIAQLEENVQVRSSVLRQL